MRPNLFQRKTVWLETRVLKLTSNKSERKILNRLRELRERERCINNLSTYLPNIGSKLCRASTPIGPRLGRLCRSGRSSIDTPHYVGITSRGVLPHISQDVMQKHTRIKGVYVALEDFVEHSLVGKTPPVLSHRPDGSSSSLRSFASLPDDQLLILGARRAVPLVPPWPNTQTAVSISTAFGFSKLNVDDYVSAVKAVKPDIVLALGDIPYAEKPGRRRRERMSLRTERWLKVMLDAAESKDSHAGQTLAGTIFAPILPVSKEEQSLYLEIVAGDWKSAISGLAIYDSDTVVEIPDSLLSLPKLSLSGLKSPSQILKEVSLSVDILTVPFIGEATDAGIALDFAFPPKPGQNLQKQGLPLGIDMWAQQHATDLSPLVDNCDCYTCSTHHRAYLHHLLSSKEMLAWALLQIHNIRVADVFFAGIRDSILRGTFGEDHEAFIRIYEEALPQTSGLGPRLRGYQYKAEGPGELKKNPKAYNTLDEAKRQNAEAPLPSPTADARDLEQRGFAQVANFEE